SKRTMGRSTRQPYRGRLIRLDENERSDTFRRCAGVVAAACTQGKRTKHGKPQGVVSDDQPEAREGQAGRPGVAERFVVPRKPGNAGGGKGPQFKTDAIRGEGPGDWETYQLQNCSEAADGVARESVKSCPRAGCGKSACPVVCPVKAGMFSRRQTCRGRSQSPVVWIAEVMETETLKPIDKVSPGEATSHRAVTKVNALWPRK